MSFSLNGELGGEAELVVYAILSLSRIAARKGERVADIPMLMSRLSIEEL